MIEGIISGYQGGADIGGILGAAELGLGTGGYMSKGWKTEDGPKPEYENLYGAVECESYDYSQRTILNVQLGDGTAIFGIRSPGSNKTEETCRTSGKPCCWVFWPDSFPNNTSTTWVNPANTFMITHDNILAFRLWIVRNKIKILNVAGNRESRNHGIEDFVKSFIIKALGEK